MAMREKFSDDEWFLLLSTPAMIGAAVASAGRSGPFGTVKEAVASLSTVLGASKAYPDNALLQELVRHPEDREAAKAQAEAYQARAREKLEDKTPEQLTEEMLSDAARVSQLLRERVSAEEAQGYRAWALEVGENVAKAAKEGSVLGIGGEQVSDEERALLGRLEQALGA